MRTGGHAGGAVVWQRPSVHSRGPIKTNRPIPIPIPIPSHPPGLAHSLVPPAVGRDGQGAEAGAEPLGGVMAAGGEAEAGDLIGLMGWLGREEGVGWGG